MLGIDFILSSLIISKPENLERGIRKKKKGWKEKCYSFLANIFPFKSLTSQPQTSCTFTLQTPHIMSSLPASIPVPCTFPSYFLFHLHPNLKEIFAWGSGTHNGNRRGCHAVLWFLMQAPVGCSHTQLQLYREAQGFWCFSDFLSIIYEVVFMKILCKEVT